VQVFDVLVLRVFFSVLWVNLLHLRRAEVGAVVCGFVCALDLKAKLKSQPPIAN
jgi:hypothetical protein